MPVVSTLGAMSSRGFGEFNQQAQGNYIEDYFSTYLYSGNGTSVIVNNGVSLSNTAGWSSYLYQEPSVSGSSFTGYGKCNALDSNGNLYITGYGSAGQAYAFLAKYNSSGILQWQRKIQQSTNPSFGQAITIDSSDNIYVAARCSDGVNTYALLLKYDTSGNLQWQRKLTQGSAAANGVTTDSSGNVYVIGYANDGFSYIFVAKYNSSGVIQFQRKIRDTNQAAGWDIKVDNSNNIYITGYAYDGSYTYIYTAQLNSTGGILWQRKFNDVTTNALGRSLSIDSSNNVYVVGQGNDGSNNYIAILKYNSSGVLQWQRKLQENGSFGQGVQIDSAGNIYVSGYAADGSSGNQYAIIAKYNSSGVIQWQRKYFTYSNLILTSVANAISIDSSGNLYSSGYVYLLNASGYSFVTLKLKSDGTTTGGSAYVVLAAGTATDSVGSGTDSASSATSVAGTATEAAGTATDSAASFIPSTYTQSSVTNAAGLVWIKDRSSAAYNQNLFDTVRGVNKTLWSNSTAAQATYASSLTSFNPSGFSLGGDTGSAGVNISPDLFTSWTFRKQPKFFDVVTYTDRKSVV